MPDTESTNIRAQFVELPQRTLPYWDVAEVRAALDLHETGQLRDSALLAEAMDRDDRIKATLDSRINGLLGLPLKIEASGNEDAALECADFVRDGWEHWFSKGDQAQLFRWALLVGVGLGEIVWQVVDGLLEPRLKVWHPQWLYWRWDLNDYQGGWQLITKDGVIEPKPGDGKWVFVTPGGSRRPWMAGLVRSLAVPYLIRGYAYRDWARYSEVHGGGIKIARVPSEARAEDKKIFMDSIASLGRNGVMILPASGEGQTAFDFSMLEAEANTWQGFQGLIQQTDTSIAIAVKGQNLTTEVQGGSFAAAGVHEGVETGGKMSDDSVLCGALREQALKPCAAYNFGDASLAPNASYDATPPEDQSKLATTANATAQAIQSLQAANVPVDARKFAEQAGIPLLDEDEELPLPDDESQGDGPVALSAQTERAQSYLDRLGSASIRAVRRSIAGDVSAVLSAIAKVPALDDGTPDAAAIEAELTRLLAEMDPTRMAKVIADQRLRANLYGRMEVKP